MKSRYNTHPFGLYQRAADAYKLKAGGKGDGPYHKTEDFVSDIFITSTPIISCSLPTGQGYRLKAYETRAGRQAKGTRHSEPAAALRRETITAVIPIRDLKEKYMLFATRTGEEDLKRIRFPKENGLWPSGLWKGMMRLNDRGQRPCNITTKNAIQ